MSPSINRYIIYGSVGVVTLDLPVNDVAPSFRNPSQLMMTSDNHQGVIVFHVNSSITHILITVLKITATER